MRHTQGFIKLTEFENFRSINPLEHYVQKSETREIPLGRYVCQEALVKQNCGTNPTVQKHIFGRHYVGKINKGNNKIGRCFVGNT